MKKKIKWMSFLLSAMFVLQGCLLDTYPLTDDERNKIAEYAACVLLRNDKYFNYTSIITPTPMPTLTQAPTPSADATPTPVPNDEPESQSTPKPQNNSSGEKAPEIKQNVSLTEVFGLAELEFDYFGYTVCERYQGLKGIGDYVVTAGQGKQLAVIAISIKNTAGIAQNLNFAPLGVSYQLDVGDVSFSQPQITLFEEDMQYMNYELAAGDTIKGVIVFQIQKDADLENANIIVARDDASAIVRLN